MKFVFLDSKQLQDKFKDLLDVKLYDEGLPNSRIRNIYEGKKYTLGNIVAVLAENEDKTVGIILCEQTEQKPFNSFKLKDPFKRGSKIKSYDDWKFVPIGFISMYVFPEFRNKGIAKEMLHLLEDNVVLDKCSNVTDVPLINAAAKAVTFVSDHAKYSHSIDVANNSVNFPSRIHFLTEAVNSKRNGEEIWSIKCGEKIEVPIKNEKKAKKKIKP